MYSGGRWHSTIAIPAMGRRVRRPMDRATSMSPGQWDMRRGPVLTVVFDAAPLSTACKFEVQGVLVIDHLLPECCIVIAPRVEEEVAILGASYPDGVVAGERIARGGIQVLAVAERKWTRYLADNALGDGERASIELCG
jgi:hypothetical protein